jgi:hypothetical protein
MSPPNNSTVEVVKSTGARTANVVRAQKTIVPSIGFSYLTSKKIYLNQVFFLIVSKKNTVRKIMNSKEEKCVDASRPSRYLPYARKSTGDWHQGFSYSDSME